MSKPNHEHPFVRYLLDRVTNDRAARAALRRSLGRAPGEAPEAFRFVVPWLPNPCRERTETIYYLIAGLYALHPLHTQTGNMGAHLRAMAAGNEQTEKRIERYLMSALRAHPNDLPNHLRRLVGILKAREIAINWNQLIWDLLNWEKEDHLAQKHWATSFWGQRKPEEQPTPMDDHGEDETNSQFESEEEME